MTNHPIPAGQVELLPCPNPWCDSLEPLWVQARDKRTNFRVECMCGFEGPVLDSEERAVAAWNSRAPSTPDTRSADVPADEDDPCAGGSHCCCCGPGEPCCDCGIVMPSKACNGEKCWCGAPAAKKVGEEILFDDPEPARHNLTAYVCAAHYAQMMGPLGAQQVGAAPPKSQPPLTADTDAIRGALPERIGRLKLGERLANGERMCHHSHYVPDRHPLYWPDMMSEYDDSDPYCLEHAIEQAESDSGWCKCSLADDVAALSPAHTTAATPPSVEGGASEIADRSQPLTADKPDWADDYAITERDANGEALVCTGCGTTRTVDHIRYINSGALTCCPERKMIAVRDALADKPDTQGLREAAQAVLDSAERPGSRAEYGIGPEGEVWHDYQEVSQKALDALTDALSQGDR